MFGSFFNWLAALFEGSSSVPVRPVPCIPEAPFDGCLPSNWIGI